jgi:NAD(P)-dependent dehydrogenase (short-subunit alcohol dehydrogenase family)
MSKVLENHVVIVTGGGRGVGRAVALHAGECGASVLVNDVGCDVDGQGIDPEVAQAVVREIRASGGRAEPLFEDVTAPGASERMVTQATATLGPVSGVVCCAGLRIERSLKNAHEHEMALALHTQVLAAWSMCRALVRQRSGDLPPRSVVLMSGPSGFLGVARQSIESACASALYGMTRSLALELRGLGVRVNAIAPLARTRITEHLPLFQSIRSESLSPRTVAPLVSFLLSGASSDISGEVLGVAGSRYFSYATDETPGVFVDRVVGERISVESASGSVQEIRALWPQIVARPG